MAAKDGRVPVLDMSDALDLYYDLLQQSKGIEEQVRLLRDRILQALAARRIDRVQVDGYEAERQIRHHPPQLNEERAIEILERHGRLEECRVEVLDHEKAREVVDELFQHGSISKDELPYVYVKPTEALVVRSLKAPEAVREERRAA
jgi:Ribonuclease G/E